MLSTLKKIFQPKNQQHFFSIDRVPNIVAYRAHLEKRASVHKFRWEKELALASAGAPFTTPGHCFPCNQPVEFKTDFLYSHTMVHGKPVPNWRERVLCPLCQMNNRTRASIQILQQTLAAYKKSRIYIAEQVTPLYGALKKQYQNLVGSEYLGEKVAFGSCDERGIRNESIIKLTFEDNSFDYILNFDVLEHIPNVSFALDEIYRVLAKNGTLLLTVPFLPGETETRVRATIDDLGKIVHLMEPQYHGDPIADAGCLCFQDFGWDLLDQMRDIGFTDVNMLLYWSEEFGYYGVEQMMIVAHK